MRRTPARTLAMSLAAAIGFGAAFASAASGSPCSLLSPAEIAKATGVTVGDGVAGPTIRGTLGKCTWHGSGKTRVIVTLGDAQHMALAVAAMEQTSGDAVHGVGSKAAGIEGPPFVGGGYIINVLDAKGGFGVSMLGKEGNRARAVALARLVESHR